MGFIGYFPLRWKCVFDGHPVVYVQMLIFSPTSFHHMLIIAFQLFHAVGISVARKLYAL